MTIKSFSRSILFAMIGMILYACGPIAQVSTPSSTPPNTPAAILTATTSPTLQPKIPTTGPTPTPPLPSHGPYFTFLTETDNGSILTLLGANGAGRADLTLPSSVQTGNCFKCVISPDGRWLAYWTGSAGEINYSSQNQLDPNGHYDLRLSLFHIADGKTAAVTGLLSPDYPANFQKNAEAIKNQSQFAGMDVPSVATGLQMSFLWGIESAAWSPDSRYLAFAGEMDGPSSDLYVYDTTSGSILRLSSGSTNIIGNGDSPIGWSPDGKWIVYTSTYFAGEGMTADVHAARPDGSDFRDYPESVESLSGWVSNSVFLFQQGENGIGEYRLESGNLDTGGTAVIWKCPFEEFAVDPQGAALIYQPWPGPQGWGCDSSGLFIKNISSGATRLLVGADEVKQYPQMEYLDQANRRFLYFLKGTGTFAVSSAGEKSLLVDANSYPVVSPDKHWVAFAGEGLRLMDPSGKMSELRTGMTTGGLTWRPDSQGFLFFSGSDAYSLTLPDETIAQMDGIQNPSSVDTIYWQPDSQGYFFLAGSDLDFLSVPEKKVVFLQTIPDPSKFDPLWVALP